MREFDSLYGGAAYPIMVCGADFKIVYKNRSAKRLIPFPRTGTNIFGYLSSDDRIRLLHQKKRRVVKLNVPYDYDTAAALDLGGENILVFPLLAQYFKSFSQENENDILDLAEQYISSLEGSKTTGLTEKELPDQISNGIRKNVRRLYDRFCASGMSGEKCRVAGALIDILSAGKSIFGKYSCRVEFNAKALEDSIGSFVSFAPFSLVLSELVLMMIGLSADRSAVIETDDRGKYIETAIRCVPRVKAQIPENIGLLDFLCGYYPGERDNIKAVGYIAERQNWHISFANDRESGTVSAVLKIYDRSDGGDRVFLPSEIIGKLRKMNHMASAALMLETFAGLIDKKR